MGVQTARQMATNVFAFFRGLQRDYGDIVHLRLGPFHDYVLFHPDQIREVLVSKAKHFEKMPRIRKVMGQLDGNGLVTSEGPFWLRQRRLVQPAFHAKRLSGYGDVMVDFASRLVEQWRTQHAEAFILDMDGAMTDLTLKIAAKTFFDADVSGKTADLGKAAAIASEFMMDEMSSLFSLPDWLPLPSKRRKHWALRYLDETVRGFIHARRQNPQDKGDLLSMLLLAVDEQDNGGLTDEQARDEVMTLFMAGHDTTASGLTWIWHALAGHPQIADEVSGELKRIIGDRRPTFTDVAQLQLLERVIKETLRMHSPAIGVLTRRAVSPVEIGGYHLAKGSLVQMMSFVPHYDPRWFTEPQTFDPERFAPGRIEAIPQFAYFPFGGGPRVCIGNTFAMAEMTLVVATILQELRVTLPPGHKPVELVPRMSLRPKGGLRLELSWRA
jgi:cytochrome P450